MPLISEERTLSCNVQIVKVFLILRLVYIRSCTLCLRIHLYVASPGTQILREIFVVKVLYKQLSHR